MAKVLVVGAFGIDTNVYCDLQNFHLITEGYFSTNEDYPGQAGNYVANSLHQLGCEVTAIAALGNDVLGDWIATDLTTKGIELIRIPDPQGTKRSINLMSQSGLRRNFYDGKGSMEIEFDLSLLPDLLSFNIAHLNIVNWARYLLPQLKEVGITISVDLQDVTTASDPYRLDFVKYADYIFFSSTNIGNNLEIISFIKEYQKINPEATFVVGHGAEGVSLYHRDDIIKMPAVVLGSIIVDTNGAGDSLATGFLKSYLIDGYSVHESLLRGQINARYTCGLRATVDNMMTKTQLDTYHKRVKQKHSWTNF